MALFVVYTLAATHSNATSSSRSSLFSLENRKLDNTFRTRNQGRITLSTPKWAEGLVVKPDQARIKEQARVWGTISAVGIIFPVALDYLSVFHWMICVTQLSNRGMPKSQSERAGMGLYTSQGMGKHRKLAFLLGLSTWISSSFVAYILMPSFARGQRYTPSVYFVLQNLAFAIAGAYLQPYKGGSQEDEDYSDE